MQWYREIESCEPISQGDILFNLPIYQVDFESIDFRNIEEMDNIGLDVIVVDVVVLSQACDLQKGILNDVVVASIYDINKVELKEGTNRWGFVREVHSNRREGYYLIGNHSSANSELTINFQIVDFTSIFTVPLGFLKRFSEFHGKRLRLNTPHRKLLSQEYGNFMSRIGLPNEDFIRKEDLKNSLYL